MTSASRLSNWEGRLQTTEIWAECYAESQSTMDIARAGIALNPGKRFGIVLSKSQTGGRGRQGKAWESAQSGFFATYCVRTGKRVNELAGFSLIVGYIVAQVLECFGCKIGLKWPNDVYTQEFKKLCGVLVEIVYVEQDTGILTGIGINLRGEPSNLDASSIHTLTGVEVSALDVAEVLSAPFFDAWDEFEKNGFTSFKKRWLSKALYLNQSITAEIGGVLRQGMFRGVDDVGQMIFEEQGNISHVSSAEIVNLRPVK